MKKVLIGLLALSAVSMAAGNTGEMYIVPNIGLDFGSSYDNAWDTDGFFAGEMGVEGFYKLNDMFDLGLGVAFQKHADIKDYWNKHHHSDEAYNSIPVYGTAKFNFPVGGEVKPFLKADLGLSFNTSDYDSGMYFGMGGGLEYQNFVFDLMYKVNDAEAGGWWDADYSRVVLGFGYRFNM